MSEKIYWVYFGEEMIKDTIRKLYTIFEFKNSILIIFLCAASCGRAYFPIEITSFSRADLKRGQENVEIQLVPMGTKTIKDANKAKYVRRVIKGRPIETCRYRSF